MKKELQDIMLKDSESMTFIREKEEEERKEKETDKGRER